MTAQKVTGVTSRTEEQTVQHFLGTCRNATKVCIELTSLITSNYLRLRRLPSRLIATKWRGLPYAIAKGLPARDRWQRAQSCPGLVVSEQEREPCR